ncbi:MAG: S41 family peptidase [Bacteroidota bacterium]
MRYGLSIFFIILYLFGFSQKKEFDLQKKYSSTQVLQDIDFTEKYLTKFHPDPYRYISKDSLHAFVTRVKAAIDTSLTEMQVRFYIKQIVAKIGCGHTDVDASVAYAKTVKKTNRPILPLNIFITDSSRLVVLNNLSTDTVIKAGDEILSIHKYSQKQIIKTIYSIYTTDGYNQTFKKQGTRHKSFKYFYSFCFGFKPEYNVKIKQEDQSIRIVNLKAISSLKDTLILPKKDSVTPLQQTKKCRYYYANSAVAVIDIDGFSGKHWYRFLRRSFKDIRKRKTENLVIDLRDNGGGQIAYGLNLLSYLIDKPNSLSFDRKPNLLPFNFRFKMGLFSRITPILFCLRFQSFPKHGRLRHYLFSLPKHRNAYAGKLFVLVNGKSFSMSGVASSYLKYKANATIIGEETGGNVAGSNAVISGKIILPNTRVRIYIPVYHIYHHINAENSGHGLMPDYPIYYSKETILNGDDPVMQKALELAH